MATSLLDTCQVLIVDEYETDRVGLSLVLGSSDRFRVVGVFPSGEDAVEAVAHLAPDVAVLDYRLSGRDGSWTCAELLRRRPRMGVLILTASFEEDVLLDCLRAGARGFLTKRAPASDIADAVLRVARGEYVLTPEALPDVMHLARQAKLQRSGCDDLSPFEAEILRSMSLGRSNREIAASLGVSEDAVKTSIRSIKKRLGASHRAQAVALAVKRGLL